MKLSNIILEGWNDNLEVDLTYTDGARLYSISFNGEKQRGDDHKKSRIPVHCRVIKSEFAR